jgi:hypothetical protein
MIIYSEWVAISTGYFSGVLGNSPMRIRWLWHGKCNIAIAQNQCYEKDHCIKPGNYPSFLFSIAGLSSFLI